MVNVFVGSEELSPLVGSKIELPVLNMELALLLLSVVTHVLYLLT